VSSGLHAHSRELKYAVQGPGLSCEGRLCSRCHRPSRSTGGGTIDGRWYCAKCKPKRGNDMAKTSDWTTRVHEHLLKTRTGMTPAMVITMFGKPPGTSAAGKVLSAASQHGWFRREQREAEGDTVRVTTPIYFAVDRANATPTRRGPEPESYFYGVKRVRSVFELWSTL